MKFLLARQRQAQPSRGTGPSRSGSRQGARAVSIAPHHQTVGHQPAELDLSDLGRSAASAVASAHVRTAETFHRRMMDNLTMPNIATILKAEITRLARKEVKSQVNSTRRINTQQRSDLADLKRRVQELERVVARLTKGAKKPAAPTSEDAMSVTRFTAKGLASQRRRLGLSAEDFGRLVGASALSVYKWEGGKAKPRAKFMPAIAAVRTMGKKEAAKRLAAG